MGGGGGHGHEPFKIPHYSIYDNYKAFPELAAHEKRLAQLGLKDPWIRNYTYLFDRDYAHVYGQWAHLKRLLRPGFKWGVGAAAVLIVAEELHSLSTKGHTSWAGHH
ncbi:unnamed protein product, partial [Mesorhabditis belari]|uniref:NADH dehydrogenase [ubiquinone] 1 beta subcomplex subunit 3 n=1 Tax=Mesorhabditis belari TaxID=2138241 RepID=A0AAF3F2D5_9BILA